MRPIDGDALYRKVKTECNPYGAPTINFEDGCKVLDMIESASTIEPRKKGKWVEIPDDIFAPIVVCSNCGQTAMVENGEYQRTRYCPNCGADMRGREDEQTD